MSEVPLCVYCRQRSQAHPWRPFCSERCRMADLGRWLSGDYRIPVRTADNEDQREEAGGNEPEDPDE